MNKQFLSLLLLTSFVGTMSSAVPVALSTIAAQRGLSVWAPNFILVGARSFGSFMGTVASKVSSVIPKALIATPLVGSVVLGETVLSDKTAARIAAANADTLLEIAQSEIVQKGMDATEAARIAAETAATEAARIATEAAATEAARPWYTKTGQVISEYASSAKTSASKGINTVVSAAKNNPKTAIAAAVVGTAAVGYLAYRLYNRSSISLNEQGRTNLRTALSEASALPSSDVWKTVMPEELVLEEYFTVEGTGLPKTAVKALNEFVTLDRSFKALQFLCDHQNGRTSPQTVAKYDATRSLRDAAENKLKALAFPVDAAE